MSNLFPKRSSGQEPARFPEPVQGLFAQFWRSNRVSLIGLRITLAYLFFGFLWIFFSDNLLALLFPMVSPMRLTQLQTYKGWFFIVITAALLFLLVYKNLSELEKARHEIEALNRDLERRVIERTNQLEAANKELEAFSFSVSHDLRAPLRSIEAFSQMLRDEKQDLLDATGQDYLSRVQAAGRRMNLLIDNLLKLARVTRSELRLETVDLTGLAREIAEELRKDHPQHQVELIIEAGLTAVADGNLMRIVLENLLGNAWKFTQKHSRARIEFGRSFREKNPVFFIRDDGAGFDMNYAARLFAPFQRLHTEGEFQGTGIGLATVQRIVARHGGKVWAEGAVERGATIFFTLKP